MARIEFYTVKNYLASCSTGAFVIPIYQRNYDWTFKNVKKLIEDLIHFYRKHQKYEGFDRRDQCYYLGSIIIKYATNSNKDDHDRIIVDGQQRLTTIFLILSILLSFKQFENEHDNYDIKRMIFVHNKDILRIKLNRTMVSETFEKIILNKNFSDEDKKNNLYRVYEDLKKYLIEMDDTDSEFVKDLYKSLDFTHIIEIRLSEIDSPTRMFETINTAGKALEPCDLIKNYIFFNSSSLSEADEKCIHTKFCFEIENVIGNIDAQNDFYRHFLAIVHNQKLVKKNSIEIYNEFKIYLDNNFQKLDTKEKLDNFIDFLISHVKIFHELTTKHISNNDYKTKIFYEIFMNAKDTYYVLAHQMLYNSKTNNGDYNKPYYFNDIMKLIAKYSVFNAICGQPEKKITRDIPTVFNQFCNDHEHFDIKTFEKWFSTEQCNKSCRMRTLEEVKLNLSSTKMYTFNKAKAQQILKCIELANSDGETKEQILSKKFTVEHIMPQNSFSKDYWRNILLSQNNNDDQLAKQFFENTVHTLPNLTLVLASLNSKLSNNSFKSKRKDFQLKTTLSINNELNKYQDWTKNEIVERSNWMIEQLAKIFN